MKKILCIFIIAFLTLSCVACKKNYYNPDMQPSPTVQTKNIIQKITLNYSKVFLNIGETMTLIVEVSPADASDKPVKFKSTNDKILSVNEKGVIFAKKEGIAVITVCSAEDENVEAKCEVTVLPIRKAIITGKVPISSEADAAYTVTVSFENCANPSIKVVVDCKGGKIIGENDTISFKNKLSQYQVIGKAKIDFTVSEQKDINSVRILCFDNGDLIDVKEYNITLLKKE